MQYLDPKSARQLHRRLQAWQPPDNPSLNDLREGGHLLAQAVPPVEAATTSPPLVEAAIAKLKATADREIWYAASVWAHGGFPDVRLTQQQTMALAATDIPPDSEALESPWRAWLLEPKAIVVEGEPVLWVLVMAPPVWHPEIPQAVEKQWMVFVRWPSKQALIKSRLGKFARVESWSHVDLDGAPSDRVIEQEEGDRFLVVLDRLLANLVAAITGANREYLVREPQPPRRKSLDKFRRHEPPPLDYYTVGIPVTIDLTPVVTEYLGGHRKSPSVQSHVRGHWRWQPWGPKRSLRRRQWIQPFWRGAEGLPVVLRPHKLKDDPDPEES